MAKGDKVQMKSVITTPMVVFLLVLVVLLNWTASMVYHDSSAAIRGVLWLFCSGLTITVVVVAFRHFKIL